MTKIIYIVGRGHSGTTLVDLLVSKALGLRSGGEIASGLSGGGSKKCTCGERMFCCDNWRDAFSAVTQSPDHFAKLISREATISRFPLIPFTLKNKAGLLEKESLFLRKLSRGKNGVVDSSKELTRAALLGFGPSKASWLHVIRDPVDVAASYRKRARKRGFVRIQRRKFWFPRWSYPSLDAFVLSSWTIWTIITLILGKVGMRQRYTILLYEELVRSPATEIQRLGKELDFAIDEETALAASLEPIAIEHMAGGNAITGQETVTLKQNHRNPEDYSAITKCLAAIFCYPVYWFISRFCVRSRAT